MKKILIATTALVSTAGVAAADITLNGYGRFGVDYNGGAAVGTAKTQINARMRVNIDGSKETDSGVTFGGRIRLQYNTNQAAGRAELNAAMLYATYGGMRLEVGNTNSAIDSVALMYNSEIGYLDRGFGDPLGGFTAYSTGTFAATPNRVGVFASYAFGDGNVRFSYINPDQTASALPVGTESEVSISGDYKFGAFTVAAAYADNANFFDGNTSLFLGAQYAITPDANVGLLHFREERGIVDLNRTTIYGNYKMGAITYKGYVASQNFRVAATDSKTAFGLGLDYDLGGARLSADIHRSYSKDTIAGLGVRFNF